METDLVREIKDRLDLAEDVIIPDIGEPKRRGARLSWVCPFHADKDPSLFLNPDGQSYRCFGCGARGDAFTWVMARERWGFRETLDYLGGLVGLTPDGQPHPERTARAPRPAAQHPEETPPGATWQARGRLFLERAKACLWEDAGAVGREYLHARGLGDDTLRAWELGWCPRDIFEPPDRWGVTPGKQIPFPRGVVIPHLVEADLWALKIRRFIGDRPATKADGRKYDGPRGGQGTLYGLDGLRYDGRPLLIVEAELDALLIWQEAGDMADVVALAGASRGIPGRWLARLLGYPRILAALDADGAGIQNAARLMALSERVTPARIPEGNDPTEYYQRGGDLRAWVGGLVGDTGAATATGARFPLRLRIPPERATLPGLAVINRQWRRLEDGSIEAVFNSSDELETCIQAMRAIRERMRHDTAKAEQV